MKSDMDVISRAGLIKTGKKVIPRNNLCICYSESCSKCKHYFWGTLYLFDSKGYHYLGHIYNAMFV